MMSHSYSREDRRRGPGSPLNFPLQRPDREGSRQLDEYETLVAMTARPTPRTARNYPLDESYLFLRLLRGTIPAEMVEPLEAAFPRPFAARRALVPGYTPRARRLQVEAFVEDGKKDAPTGVGGRGVRP